MANYFTISGIGEGLVREKMSRFISYAIPVTSAEQAMSTVKEYQNRYHDARHVCWAYMLGAARETWQLNDNGEPSGTAGKPILGQINSKGLTDVLVVVIRYFGGIKLGTSGLIAAYREAARLALDDAPMIEMHEMDSLELEFPYEVMNDVMKVIKAENLEIAERDFDNICRITLAVKKAETDRLTEILEKKGSKITNREKK